MLLRLISLQSVSYTHLDVYKRQVKEYSEDYNVAYADPSTTTTSVTTTGGSTSTTVSTTLVSVTTDDTDTTTTSSSSTPTDTSVTPVETTVTTSVSTEDKDPNGDGKLDVRDCAYIARMLATGQGKKLPMTADFNGDGKVNVLSLIHIYFQQGFYVRYA